MNQIFYLELKEKCREISLDTNNTEKIVEVNTAYDRLIDLANVARRGGIFEFENYTMEIEDKNDTDKFLKKIVTLVVDGTQPEMVEEIGLNTVISNCLQSYDGFITLMYLYGVLMIQQGYNPRLIDELLCSIIPKCL